MGLQKAGRPGRVYGSIFQGTHMGSAHLSSLLYSAVFFGLTFFMAFSPLPFIHAPLGSLSRLIWALSARPEIGAGLNFQEEDQGIIPKTG